MAKTKTKAKARPGKTAKRATPARRASVAKSKAAAKPAKSGAKSSASNLSHARDRAVDAVRFGAAMFDRLVADWPADKLCVQPSGGDNHVLWTIGHLAVSYKWFADQFGGKVSVPEHYNALFGYGSKPGSDANEYPSLNEVQEHCRRARQACLDTAERLTDKELASPISPDMASFAKDKLAVIERLAWHDGWHSGQLSALRRAIGLPGVM